MHTVTDSHAQEPESRAPPSSSPPPDNKELAPKINPKATADLLTLINEQLDDVYARASAVQLSEDEGVALYLSNNSKVEQDSSEVHSPLFTIEDENVNNVRDSQVDKVAGSFIVRSSPFEKKSRQESMFKRQESQISVYMEHGLESIQKAEKKESRPKYRGTNAEALTKFMLALSNFANYNKFEIVRCTREDILIRKRKYPTLIYRILMSVWDPLVIQLTMNYVSFEAELVHISGSEDEFLAYKSYIELLLWDTKSLLLCEYDELRLFLYNAKCSIIRIRHDILDQSGVFTGGMTSKEQDHCRQSMYIVMEQRDKLLTDMHKQGIDSASSIHELDRFLLKESGLADMHTKCSKSLQKKFNKIRSKARKCFSPEECLQQLEVDKDFQLASNDSKTMPYQRAMKYIEQLNTFQTLYDKTSCLVRVSHTIRYCVSDYHHGRKALDSMDNMLPLTIYILLYSYAYDVFSNIYLVDTFVNYRVGCGSDYEAQRRTILNFHVSLEFILSDSDVFVK